jgi:hypothetical protein
MRHLRPLALVAAAVLTASVAVSTAASAQTSPQKPTASEIGVTATTIRIAVVADVDNSISPGIFAGSVAGVRGWAAYTNAHGGLAGRKVVVDFIDSHLSPSDARNAVIQACSQDFALVGTSAVFLNDVSDIESCVDQAGAATGLPDLALVATELAQQCSPTTFAVNPSPIICSTENDHPQTYQANMGRAFYYESKFGKNLHGLYLLSGDLQSTEDSNRASMNEMQTAGSGIKSDLETTISAAAPQSAYTPLVLQLKQHNSTYAQSGSAVNTTILLRKEAQLQGLTSPNFIWDCTLQCYDQSLLAAGPVVNGTYVSLLFLPFEEASSNPTLANFLKYTGKSKADGFGIQAYASGLLLSQAIDQVVKTDGVNGVTRKAVFRQLSTITAFNAGGMIGTTNIAGRRVSPCYVLTKVENGKFVRVTPTKKGTFDCSPRNVSQIKIDITQ